MANSDIILPSGAARELPVVRSIGVRDLRDALAMGLEDFWAMPTHVIFLGLIPANQWIDSCSPGAVPWARSS